MLKRGFGLACVLALSPATAWGQAKLDRVVLAYSAAWRDAASPAGDCDYAGLTYLARAFLNPAPDGSITAADGYFNPVLERAAHGHGVKLLMSVGGGSGTEARWVAIATHPEALKKFLDNLGQLMAANHYDGVDVDWEPSPATLDEGRAYTTVLAAVRGRFPHAVLTTAVDTDEYATKFVSWPDVVAAVDYVNVMTYDYAGPWGGVAGHATNLYPAGDYPAIAQHSADEGMRNLLQHHHLPPGKCLMGMNFWAARFRVDHLGDRFPKNGEGYSDNVSYAQVLDLMGTGHYLARWDARAAAPYLVREGGGSVVCYDDPESIRRKCEYARAAGCAGVMVWNLGADVCGRQAPLMDAVVQSCGGRAAVLPRGALEHEVANLRQEMGRPAAAAGSDEELESAWADLGHDWGERADQRWRAAAARP